MGANVSVEAMVALITGLFALIGLGVGIGINYGRITAVEQSVATLEKAVQLNTMARENMMVQVGILQTQMTEIIAKMAQLQMVVVETRNAVLRRRSDDQIKISLNDFETTKSALPGQEI